MKFKNIKVYIAAPFFNDDQLSRVMEIENVLDWLGIKYFSPRYFGVISRLKEMEKGAKIAAIYDMNIEQLCSCNTMIAITDGHDVGAIFELGYFVSLKDNVTESEKTIVTLSNNNFGLNVMLKFGVDCHVKSHESLRCLLTAIKRHGSTRLDIFEAHDRSNEVTT